MSEGTLIYARSSKAEAFTLTISNLMNPTDLVAELKCLESEYKENVQTFTYHKLLDSLSENKMSIETETVLEDDTIMLTLTINE